MTTKPGSLRCRARNAGPDPSTGHPAYPASAGRPRPLRCEWLRFLLQTSRHNDMLCVLNMTTEPGSPSLAALETAGLLHRQATRLTRRLRATRPPNSPGLSKLGILARLREDGPATAKSLAGYLGLQPQSMTRLLSAMESAGLIQRHPDKTDRRQIRIELTAAGQRVLLDDLARRRERLARSMMRLLTPAEMELLRIAAGLMDRVAAAVEAPAPSGGPGGTMPNPSRPANGGGKKIKAGRERPGNKWKQDTIP